MKRGIIIIVCILFYIPFISSLGISPGRIDQIIFEPNLELEYDFQVFEDPNQKIEVFAKGEFTDLVQFDRKELKGNEHFKVRFILPNSIEEPGKHTLIIGAAEKVEQEEGKSVVKTRVVVQVRIVVFVPYPGRYAEIDLLRHNANAGEPIKFEIIVNSLGYRTILATANLEIFDKNDNKIDRFDLGSKTVKSQAGDSFIYNLDTKNYEPADYKAIATVDYIDGIIKVDRGFRIGHLFVNITNHTTEVVREGIRPFDIHVESLWNDPIGEIHGEVSVIDDGENILNFLTPSIGLGGFEKRTLVGYVDTSILNKNKYDLEIKLKYKDQETIVKGELLVKEKGYFKYIKIILLVLIIVIIGIILYLIRKHAKKTKRARKTRH